MSTTKSKKAITPKEKAEALAVYYAEKYNEKRELDEVLKEIKEELEDYAINNSDDFEGKKTLDLGDAKLVWKLKTTVKTETGFNPTEFLKAYPDACDVKIKPSKLINIDLGQWGIEKEEENVFSVEVK